jgi:hypothetical protein
MLKSFFQIAKGLYGKAVDFAKTKGFTAMVALGLGSLFLLGGYPFIGGIGFGIFFSKNSEIIKGMLENSDII